MLNIISEKLKAPDTGLIVLRMALGLLLILHGINKLQYPGSIDWITGQLQGVGLPGVIAYGVLDWRNSCSFDAYYRLEEPSGCFHSSRQYAVWL